MLKIQYQTNSGVDDGNLHVLESSFFLLHGSYDDLIGGLQIKHAFVRGFDNFKKCLNQAPNWYQLSMFKSAPMRMVGITHRQQRA